MTIKTTDVNAYNVLVEHGIKPSVQRLAIMDYLLTHYTHPTVEEVFLALRGDIPTLSRTTVYKTLRMLSEHKAAQMITIDDHRVCYDGDTTPHVHFFCKHCGNVWCLRQAQTFEVEIPLGFQVEEEEIVVRGLCRACQEA